MKVTKVMSLAQFWYLINFGFIGLFIFGSINSISFLIYILITVAWVASILGLFLIRKDIIQDMISKNYLVRSVPSWISISTDLIIAFLFLYTGYIILTFFWLMQAMIQERAFLIATALKDN